MPLGDMPAAEFRKHLHEIADWIADYRENIAQTRISPNEKPGAIRAKLPASAPENGGTDGRRSWPIFSA